MMDMKELNKLQMIRDSIVDSEVSGVKNIDKVKVEVMNKVVENKINNRVEQKQPIREVRRGQIFMARLHTDIEGSEQGGVRPVIIIQNNIGNRYSSNIIAVPATSSLIKKLLKTHATVNGCGLEKESTVLCEMPMTLSKSRLLYYIGAVDEITMKRIDKAHIIATSDLKPKNTFEKLDKEKQQYILDKLNIIKECEIVLNFFHRLNSDAQAIELAEDEKFNAENALMNFCYNNGLNCDEFYTEKNGINQEIAL